MLRVEQIDYDSAVLWILSSRHSNGMFCECAVVVVWGRSGIVPDAF